MGDIRTEIIGPFNRITQIVVELIVSPNITEEIKQKIANDINTVKNSSLKPESINKQLDDFFNSLISQLATFENLVERSSELSEIKKDALKNYIPPPPREAPPPPPPLKSAQQKFPTEIYNKFLFKAAATLAHNYDLVQKNSGRGTPAIPKEIGEFPARVIISRPTTPTQSMPENTFVPLFFEDSDNFDDFGTGAQNTNTPQTQSYSIEEFRGNTAYLIQTFQQKVTKYLSKLNANSNEIDEDKLAAKVEKTSNLIGNYLKGCAKDNNNISNPEIAALIEALTNLQTKIRAIVIVDITNDNDDDDNLAPIKNKLNKMLEATKNPLDTIILDITNHTLKRFITDAEGLLNGLEQSNASSTTINQPDKITDIIDGLRNFIEELKLFSPTTKIETIIAALAEISNTGNVENTIINNNLNNAIKTSRELLLNIIQAIEKAQAKVAPTHGNLNTVTYK